MTIRNTERDGREHVELAHATGIPVNHFVSGKSILAQEAQGQREVLESTLIPTDMNGCTAEEFEALGFVLGPVKADDPMWREATLPDGWAREGSSHSMWSYIVDERGFRRCLIFYKAAFYDRSAHIGIDPTPATKAQKDAYEDFYEWCSYGEGWTVLRKVRDGDNLLYHAELCVLEKDGSKVFDHKIRDWKRAGRARTRLIAPDGSVVAETDSASS